MPLAGGDGHHVAKPEDIRLSKLSLATQQFHPVERQVVTLRRRSHNVAKSENIGRAPNNPQATTVPSP
jgi:hypothetical protein